jgi:hypothetical protein
MRNLAQIIPLGHHLSINLQLSISRYVINRLSSNPYGKKESIKSRLKRIWNKHVTVHLSKSAITDLQFITSLLRSAPLQIWERPISLLVPRDSHFISKSDASDFGLGGFCIPLPFQWRLHAGVLADFKLHINIKEFIAILINVYFMMITFRAAQSTNSLPPNLGDLDGWIFELLTDNTTAISWVTHASRTRDRMVIRLTHLFSRLVYSFNSHIPSLFKPIHLPGILNDEADALSRPLLFPTYSAVFKKYPILSSLPPRRPPTNLVSLLRDAICGSWTEERIEKTTTALLRAAPTSFAVTAPNWESQTLPSVFSHSKTKKAS